MISARGLSFCAMILSRICMKGMVERTVIVLAVLLGAIIGCTAIPAMRMSWLRVCASSVGSAFEM
jgi:hypothetical protein